MNDHTKNIIGSVTSGAGFLGGITLKSANDWAALACSVFGTVAATLTIASIVYGWWNKRKHKKK